MTASSRINEATIKIAIIFLMVLVGSSLQAQSINDAQYAGTAYNSRIDESPAGENLIRLVTDINTSARPVQLQNSINSPFDDIKPKLTPNGNRLYFSRNFHPGNSNGVNDPEDIWYSDFNKNTNSWSEPIHMTGVLNNAGPNYVNNVSATGDTIVLGNQYMKKGKMRAGLSYSVNVDGEWSVPVTIDIVNDYNMSNHANSFVSLNNGIIIQSVQRIESIGERDLFVSFWDGEKATEPISMGNVINTGSEESSPFLADDKTLYFASKGHHGFGGYDIYVSKRLDDSWTNWSKPENLGPAVNGALDDEFFTITHDGNYAVFTKQINIHNNDLFRISTEVLFGKLSSERNGIRRQNTSFASLEEL